MHGIVRVPADGSSFRGDLFILFAGLLTRYRYALAHGTDINTRVSNGDMTLAA